MSRYWALATLLVLAIWSVAVLLELRAYEWLFAVVLVALAASFAGVTLGLQRRSRKTVSDTTRRAFRFGMACMLAGLACVLADAYFDNAVWSMLAGSLILYGGFTGVIEGMLYKIVPFLAWLHLSQEGVRAPNMKKLQPEPSVRRQSLAHGIALATVLVAILSGNAMLARLAGLLVAVEFAWLLWNMLGVVRAYRKALNLGRRIAHAPIHQNSQN